MFYEMETANKKQTSTACVPEDQLVMNIVAN